MSSATRCFGANEVPGKNSRGTFYPGKLSNGCQVLMKWISPEFLNANGVDRRQMMKEIKAISCVRHPNLVPVRGWCHDKGDIIIVYEFLSHGGLKKWLFGVKTTSVLLYLTFGADFGFVLSGLESKRFEAAVSQAVDVFEFGVFVLEVKAGGKRSDSDVVRDQTDLLDFTRRMQEADEKAKVIDRRMGSLVHVEQAIRVLEIGLLCTVNESKGRPSTDQVVELLCTGIPVPEQPSSRPMSLIP